MNLEEEILKKIKNKKIRPIPKWQFVFKNYFIWILSFVSFILGSIAFSLIIFKIKNIEWEILNYYNFAWINLFLFLVPFVWIIVLVFFLLLTIFHFRYTKKGYRFSYIWVFSGSIFGSFLVGLIIYYMEIAFYLENEIQNKVPLYRLRCDMVNYKWMNEGKGLLMGEIKKIYGEDESVIMFLDINKKLWRINLDNTFIPGFLQLSENLKIRVIGEKINDQIFVAHEIKPWPGHGNGKGKSKGIMNNKQQECNFFYHHSPRCRLKKK